MMVAAGGKINVYALGEVMVYHAIHPVWTHIIFPSTADAMLSRHNLDRSGRIEVELTTGEVFVARRPPPPSSMQPARATARIAAAVSHPRRTAEDPAEPQPGPARPTARPTMDVLLRRLDTVRPPGVIEANPAAVRAARLALGRYACRLPDFQVHELAHWLDRGMH